MPYLLVEGLVLFINVAPRLYVSEKLILGLSHV